LGYYYADAIGMDLPVRFIPGYDINDKRKMKFGTAILSKYKIIKSEVIELTKEDKRLIIKTDIEVKDKILHVFSVHLKHTHQKKSELQDLQVENLLKFLPPKNTVVMGDFNSLPESSVIKKMNESLQNTEIDSDTPTWSVYREGCTCFVEDKIVYKLDYIFTSKDMKASSFKVYDSKASDHLPISAIIEI
jgi:endonuclease/exonuclease/phosphatase family metal-dependent hydrolase